MHRKSLPTLVLKASKILLAVLAIAIGLYPLFYFLTEKFGMLGSKSGLLLVSIAWNSAFYLHIVTGGLALLIGWVQFSQKIRISAPGSHRIIGKLYVAFAICSSVSAIYLAFYANGGLTAVLGFLCLAIVWFSSTYIGYFSILKGQVVRHQRFMIISYAACFAAVTLRIWLPILVFAFQDFIKAYVIVAWLCWLPNMAVAYFIIRNLKTPAAGASDNLASASEVQ